MGGSAQLAAAGPRDAGVSDPAAVTAAGKAAAVTIEFLEDGRCATSSAGQGFKSSTTYRPKGEQAGERRCAMPPVRPGTNVNLTGEQRQAIRAAIADGPRIELPDAEVGIDLPDRVELRTFPGEVRSQVRRIDACRYVLLNDNRIAVVAPRSREIVLIIE